MQSKKLVEIAKTCHEMNKLFCEALGDFSNKSWDEAPDNIKESTMDGVRFVRKNPNKTSEEVHQNWVDFKVEDGWVYGKKKDPKKKTHPCLVRYDDLPKEQKAKDQIFRAVAKAL